MWMNRGRLEPFIDGGAAQIYQVQRNLIPASIKGSLRQSAGK